MESMQVSLLLLDNHSWNFATEYLFTFLVLVEECFRVRVGLACESTSGEVGGGKPSAARPGLLAAELPFFDDLRDLPDFPPQQDTQNTLRLSSLKRERLKGCHVTGSAVVVRYG